MFIARNSLPVRSSQGPRARLLLCAGFALGVVLLTFGVARAQKRGDDDAIFRKLTDDYCAAWSTGNTDNAAKFYAQDNDLIFYDVTPFSYHGWKEYVPGVHKALLDSAAEVKLTAGKDLKVTRRSNVTWTTVPMHFYEKTKDGKVMEAELRYTSIWEKRGSNWLLVHEHVSVPMAGN
ncbi:MAG TPA: nuclear transport factor 2 family protein [Methylomirabilota bacterium]|jgi:ketosteroid isomerase-like protein|nr:nuclear transport factor 2 family protein [Methylomirabilota bacterium]